MAMGAKANDVAKKATRDLPVFCARCIALLLRFPAVWGEPIHDPAHRFPRDLGVPLAVLRPNQLLFTEWRNQPLNQQKNSTGRHRAPLREHPYLIHRVATQGKTSLIVAIRG
jgi:hypothetical protein